MRPVGDFELASRLSYFLWSSTPDEELLVLAAKNQLHDDNILAQQIRRMLAENKSQALVDNFVTQWLNLRLLDGVAPDPQVFPQSCRRNIIPKHAARNFIAERLKVFG